MKNGLLVLGGLLCGSVFAAGAEQPLLEKHYTNGFVPPQNAIEKECRLIPLATVGRYRVVTHTITGSRFSPSFQDTTTSREVELQVGIKNLIESALMGKVDTSPAPTDGPITEWAVYNDSGHDSGAGSFQRIVIRARGSEIVDNRSSEAATLVKLIDSVCQWAN